MAPGGAGGSYWALALGHPGLPKPLVPRSSSQLQPPFHHWKPRYLLIRNLVFHSDWKLLVPQGQGLAHFCLLLFSTTQRSPAQITAPGAHCVHASESPQTH